jgi:small-conductance mechanosensitive channel
MTKLPFFHSLTRDYVVNKTFSYKKRDITLNFTLRIDKKQDLQDFEELLVAALAEIREEIQKHGNR